MPSTRRLTKTLLFHARKTRVRALAAPRSIGWLRRRLHLPRNAVFDPLADREAGVEVVRLDEAAEFRRPLPRLPNASDAARAFYADRALERTTASFVAQFSGAVAWGHPAGGVFTGSGRFVPVLTRDPCGPDLHSVWTRLRLPTPTHLGGRTLYLVTPEAADNFHHWLIDLLPRLGLVQRAGHALADFDHVIVNHTGRRYQFDTLQQLGIPPEKIVAADESVLVRTDTLVVPSLKTSNQTLPAEDPVYLRARFLGAAPPVRGERRLYLSRDDAAFRRLSNEADLLPLLHERGFEVLVPGRLSLAEQARRFADASMIVGPAGAAFANLVFATPGTRVIEIAPPGWLAAFHWMISARLGLDHTILLGEGAVMRGIPDATARAADIVVDPARLAALLPARTPCPAPSAV